MPGRGTLVARTALQVAPVHIPDVLTDTEYTWHEGQRLAGFRAMLGVPMLREGSCVGVMAIDKGDASAVHRQADRACVQNFAAQAVIAIENTRLLNELRAIAGAADGDRRRTQGYQRLGFRSAACPQYDCRDCGPALQC